jgi:hypothetical protein
MYKFPNLFELFQQTLLCKKTSNNGATQFICENSFQLVAIHIDAMSIAQRQLYSNAVINSLKNGTHLNIEKFSSDPRGKQNPSSLQRSSG